MALRAIHIFLLAVGVAILSFLIAYMLIKQSYGYAFIFLVLDMFLVYKLWYFHKKLIVEISDFSEAVKYNDFTRRFTTKDQRSVEGRLYGAFNQINTEFRNISSEMEVQHQYLTRIINMLDSAIIFYKVSNGEVEWINEAFKNLFFLPYVGNIKGLKKKYPPLYKLITKPDVGKQHIHTLRGNKDEIKLLMQVSEFDTQEGKYRIVAFQNIKNTIDETENKAWQKLLKVLTHEIMNSIAPISSLADTLHDRLISDIKADEREDIRLGIHTIKKRSEGLMRFAKSYRMINKVDRPNFEYISVLHLFDNIGQLMEPTLHQKDIDLDVVLKSTKLSLYIDPYLIEQVLINLLLNAIDAVEGIEQPFVNMTARVVNARVQILIQDNGKGMAPDLQEQIFTPFFTTKNSGSGVGLTLTKQIMLVHGGNVFLNSEQGKGSTFILQF